MVAGRLIIQKNSDFRRARGNSRPFVFCNGMVLALARFERLSFEWLFFGTGQYNIRLKEIQNG
ncbi:hypothetical protein DYI21_02090 [Thalassospira tepidiphila]|nr:hypothetical protein [Thalassospira tepidiphila]